VLALDTNLLVRLTVNDDLRQAAAAVRTVDGGACFVAVTVTLEYEWVLRGSYRLAVAVIADSLDALLSVQTLRFEDEPAIRAALTHYRAGMDFADALHYERTRHCEAFVSFDARFIRRAKRLGLTPLVRSPIGHHAE
jgi:predicted nucleic-acid-binding protein